MSKNVFRGSAARKVGEGARDVGDHPALQYGARAGFVANGLVHLLLGWLAAQLALHRYSGTADQNGALATLAQTPVGLALAVACLAGFALLALWSATEAIRPRPAKERLSPAAKAVVYVALAVVAVRVLTHQGSSSAQNTRDLTGTLLANPLGVALVVVVGLVILGVAAYHVYSGITRRFRKQLRRDPGDVVEWLGVVGYVAKGLALGVVGILFLAAAVTHDTAEANGLDGALRSLLQLPYGGPLVIAVGLGLAAFGCYSIARARYAKV